MKRELHTIDVSDKSVGRVATEIAALLRGKNKSEYQPHLDQGDIVEIIGAAKLKFTGKKLEQKKYYHYSGYPGGLKTIKLEELFKKDPGEVLRRAVREMLPNNRLRKGMMKRLRIKL